MGNVFDIHFYGVRSSLISN